LADRMALDNVRSTVRRLVEDYSYLPYALDADLVAVELCRDIDCVRERAVKVLAEEGGEAELRRQLVLMLSAYRVLVGVNPYVLAKVRGYALDKLPSSTYEYLRWLVMGKERLLRENRMDIVRVYGDLFQLNFAYAPPRYATDALLELGVLKRAVDRLEDKVLVATLQSASVVGRMPLRYFEPSTVDWETAEKVVSICLGLRQRIVEAFLRLNLRDAEDIFSYAYSWASEEARKLKAPDHLVRNLGKHVYTEVFTAPYYLHRYGIINDGILHY